MVGSALIDKIAEVQNPQQAIDGVLGLCRELAEGVRDARLITSGTLGYQARAFA